MHQYLAGWYLEKEHNVAFQRKRGFLKVSENGFYYCVVLMPGVIFTEELDIAATVTSLRKEKQRNASDLPQLMQR